MATQAERQRAYRERKRAEGKRDRLYFATDEQDSIIRKYLAGGEAPKEGTRIPEEWISDKDRMEAIRDHLFRAEARFRNRDGSPMRMAALIAKLDAFHAKVLKGAYKNIQDLVILLARRAGYNQ